MGNGIDIYFWHFNWVYLVPLFNFLTDQQRSQIDLNDRVRDYIVNGAWNVPKLSIYVPDDIAHKICSILYFVPFYAMLQSLAWEK